MMQSIDGAFSRIVRVQEGYVYAYVPTVMAHSVSSAFGRPTPVKYLRHLTEKELRQLFFDMRKQLRDNKSVDR